MLGFKLFYYANFLSYLGSSDFHFYSFGIHNLIRIKNICFEIIGQIPSPTLPPSLCVKECTKKTDTPVSRITGLVQQKTVQTTKPEWEKSLRNVFWFSCF